MAPPSPTPTEVPAATWLPDGTMALYGAGPYESPTLYALNTEGGLAELEQTVAQSARISRSGRWLATPTGDIGTGEVVITNLENGTTYTIPPIGDFTVYGVAFDADATRVAIIELGPPEGGTTPWGIVVVDLADGSTRRFEATTGTDSELLPGYLIGWSSDELLLNTFMPYTEGGSQGVWGFTIPDDAAPAPVTTLSHREILPGEAYLLNPALSPDGTKLAYLGRDYDYTPDGYEPVAYDLAVNQLGTVDLASGEASLLVEITDGGALGPEVTWVPNSEQIMFTRGIYSGDTFSSLTLRVRDETGTITELLPMPLSPQGFLTSLSWCRPEIASFTLATRDGTQQLYLADLSTSSMTLLTSAPGIFPVGCLQ
jgi:Tol biopolymer transport system component